MGGTRYREPQLDASIAYYKERSHTISAVEQTAWNLGRARENHTVNYTDEKEDICCSSL